MGYMFKLLIIYVWLDKLPQSVWLSFQTETWFAKKGPLIL